MRCRPSWSLSTLGSKCACDENRRSSVTYASISVFPPHPIPSSRTSKYVVFCCCLHIKSRSDLYSVPSNIRTGPTDANAFRGHRLTTPKGYTYDAYKTRNILLKKLLDRNTGFYGDKILYKNLDLTQDSPNKILFNFLWEQNLVQDLPKIFRWSEMCSLGKIVTQGFQMAAVTKILMRQDRSIAPLLFLGDNKQKTLETQKRSW